MKNARYVVSSLKRVSVYADVWFVAYIIKYYLLAPDEKNSAIVFLLAWLSLFIVATRDFLTFWKGHFCTGMVPDDVIRASYVSLAAACFFAQTAAYVETRSAVDLALTAAMLIINLASFLSIEHYFFLIFFAFNYFLMFFRLTYMVKLV